MSAGPVDPRAAARPDDAGAVTAVAGLALIGLVLLWFPRYLPMVDLPQHAAQVAMWTRFDDPAFGFGAQPLEFNWFTPYLLGYSIARLFATVVPVFVAVKLTVSLAVVALPCAMLALLRAAGADRWWAVAGIPLALGFSFLWGFINFLVAAPIGLLLVALACSAVERPGPRRSLALAALALLAFFGHAVVLALCGLAAAVVLARSAGSLREAFRRVLPLAAPIPLVALWLAVSLGSQAQTREPPEWAALATRPLQLPALLIGLPTDRVAFGFVVGLVLLLLLLGVRARRLGRHWPAPAVALLAFLAAPSFGLGVAMLYQRLAIFVGALVPLALTLPDAPRRRLAARAALVLAAASWLAILGARFSAFDRDARGIDRLIEAAGPRLTVRGLIFGTDHPSFRGLPLFLHFPAWYQVEKGGAQGFSFAQFFPELVRYRETPPWAIPLGFEGAPERFAWARDWQLYDAYVVRAPVDPSGRLFPGAGNSLTLAAREGSWWLFVRSAPKGAGP